jgi:hypothetical protein
VVSRFKIRVTQSLSGETAKKDPGGGNDAELSTDDIIVE